MNTITIEMEGGLIQHIEGIPKNYQVRVLDFDEDADQTNFEEVEGYKEKAYVTYWP